MRWKIVDWRGRRYCGVGEELAIGVVVVVDARPWMCRRDVDQPRKQQNRGLGKLWFIAV